MRYVVGGAVALALAGACIRERPRGAGDGGASEALRVQPGHEVARGGVKPDVPTVAAPAPPERSLEEELRRCDPRATGAVTRLPDEVVYALSAGPTVTVGRRSAGTFGCERYGVRPGAAQAAWPGSGASAGRVVLATAAATGATGAALLELGAGDAVRGVALINGACAAGSTVRPTRVFEGAPAVLVRCWVPVEGGWTALDTLVHRGERGWETLASSESGRVARTATVTTPPANPTLPGAITVAETGASPRLEVSTSSVDVHTGRTKFSQQTLRWSAAEGRFRVDGMPSVPRAP